MEVVQNSVESSKMEFSPINLKINCIMCSKDAGICPVYIEVFKKNFQSVFFENLPFFCCNFEIFGQIRKKQENIYFSRIFYFFKSS